MPPTENRPVRIHRTGLYIPPETAPVHFSAETPFRSRTAGLPSVKNGIPESRRSVSGFRRSFRSFRTATYNSPFSNPTAIGRNRKYNLQERTKLSATRAAFRKRLRKSRRNSESRPYTSTGHNLRACRVRLKVSAEAGRPGNAARGSQSLHRDPKNEIGNRDTSKHTIAYRPSPSATAHPQTGPTRKRSAVPGIATA